jgi:hypothetical protein
VRDTIFKREKQFYCYEGTQAVPATLLVKVADEKVRKAFGSEGFKMASGVRARVEHSLTALDQIFFNFDINFRKIVFGEILVLANYGEQTWTSSSLSRKRKLVAFENRIIKTCELSRDYAKGE